MIKNFDERISKIEQYVKPLKPQTEDEKELDEALRMIDPQKNPLSVEEIEKEIEKCKALPEEAFIIDPSHPERVFPAHFGAIFKKLTLENLEYLKHCKQNPVRGEKIE